MTKGPQSPDYRVGKDAVMPKRAQCGKITHSAPASNYDDQYDENSLPRQSAIAPLLPPFQERYSKNLFLRKPGPASWYKKT